MSMNDQLQKLVDLINEQTQPPVRDELRFQVELMREQVEAYQASSDKQDETLAAQLRRITELTETVADRDRQIADLQLAQTQAKNRALDELARRSHKLWHSKDLNHDA